MNHASPGGPIPSYESRTVNYTDDQRPLNLLWAVGFGPIEQPAEATDEEVRAAIDDLEHDNEPAEATDAEVREAIFASESPDGQTARDVSELDLR